MIVSDEDRRAFAEARAAKRGGGPPEDVRPEIRIRQELAEVTDEAVAALAAMAQVLRLYVRGRQLVSIARDGSPPSAWITRWPGSPVIVQLEQAAIRRMLDRAARWVQYTASKKDWTPRLPPTWVAQDVVSRLTWPLPYLEAVIESPTIRADGSILDAAGWDQGTGLLYDPLPGAAAWPAIPEEPGEEDVDRALKGLAEPLAEFPFVAESDRAASLAAILSLLARHLIGGPVPMYVIRAPTPGTGKTLLADVIGLVGTGRELPAMAHTHDSEELRKRITSLAVEGATAVLLDNVTGSLGSDILASALTKTEWEDRILGSTATVRVPLRAVWLATGNNVGFKRTLGRRVLPIDLDAGVEVPEDRSGWKHEHLIEWTKAHRPALAAAALTLLRAYILAGKPQHGKPRMGSFEAWDDLIRGCVVWLGMEDPAGIDPGKARARVRAEADDDTENLGAMLAELRAAFGDALWTAAEAIKESETRPDLKTALEASASNRGGKVTAASLGFALRAAMGRPVHGLILRRKATGSHTRLWRVYDA